MKNRLNYIVLSILVSVFACSISSAQIVITPVNELDSSADDFATTLVKNSRKMYFSSDRRGQQQVFEVTRDKSGELSVEGRVRGDVNHSDQSGSVTLTPDGQTLYFVSDRSSGKGDFLVTLKPGHTYSVTATAPNYFFYSEKFTIPENARGDEINKNIELSHNSTRLLVTFDFNKATLNDESIPDLENLLELLKDKSNMDCVLEGHTDDVGSDDFNMKLSKERADAVKTWLVNNGIKSSRIETKGYGESRPLIKETTEEARAMNRRVEIKLK